VPFGRKISLKPTSKALDSLLNEVDKPRSHDGRHSGAGSEPALLAGVRGGKVLITVTSPGLDQVVLAAGTEFRKLDCREQYLAQIMRDY